MKIIRLLLTICILMLLWYLPGNQAMAQSTPSPIERQWNVDGVARQALIYLPTKTTAQHPPVVFAFHGHGGTMAQAARSFGFHTAWPEAIVVYMQGLKTPGQLTDPTGQRPGWQAKPGDQQDRDLKFFDAVFASLKADYKIDEARVFATGHSNGGSFTYLLWASRGKLFRAVAPSSAIPGAFFRDLTPKPVIHLAGENDPLVKYAWQQRTFDYLRKLNACTADGRPWGKAGTLVGTQYASSTETPLVTLIHPGGHRFPSEATALIVRFFQESVSSK